jgi:hypothetical protein
MGLKFEVGNHYMSILCIKLNFTISVQILAKFTIPWKLKATLYRSKGNYMLEITSQKMISLCTCTRGQHQHPSLNPLWKVCHRGSSVRPASVIWVSVHTTATDTPEFFTGCRAVIHPKWKGWSGWLIFWHMSCEWWGFTGHY